MMPPSYSHRRGFTLLELSVVLAVIGLIVGGLFVGELLIKAATIRSQISQLTEFDQATTAFRTKYRSLPGDMASSRAAKYNFYTRSGTAGCGNGNGSIEGVSSPGDIVTACAGGGNEWFFFWDDLYTAGLLKNEISASEMFSDLSLGKTLPKAEIGSGYVLAGGGGGGKPIIYYILDFANTPTQTINNSPVGHIASTDAFAYDTKIDDGRPNGGSVWATSPVNPNNIMASGDMYRYPASSTQFLAKKAPNTLQEHFAAAYQWAGDMLIAPAYGQNAGDPGCCGYNWEYGPDSCLYDPGDFNGGNPPCYNADYTWSGSNWYWNPYVPPPDSSTEYYTEYSSTESYYTEYSSTEYWSTESTEYWSTESSSTSVGDISCATNYQSDPICEYFEYENVWYNPYRYNNGSHPENISYQSGWQWDSGVGRFNFTHANVDCASWYQSHPMCEYYYVQGVYYNGYNYGNGSYPNNVSADTNSWSWDGNHWTFIENSSSTEYWSTETEYWSTESTEYSSDGYSCDANYQSDYRCEFFSPEGLWYDPYNYHNGSQPVNLSYSAGWWWNGSQWYYDATNVSCYEWSQDNPICEYFPALGMWYNPFNYNNGSTPPNIYDGYANWSWDGTRWYFSDYSSEYSSTETEYWSTETEYWSTESTEYSSSEYPNYYCEPSYQNHGFCEYHAYDAVWYNPYGYNNGSNPANTSGNNGYGYWYWDSAPGWPNSRWYFYEYPSSDSSSDSSSSSTEYSSTEYWSTESYYTEYSSTEYWSTESSSTEYWSTEIWSSESSSDSSWSTDSSSMDSSSDSSSTSSVSSSSSSSFSTDSVGHSPPTGQPTSCTVYDSDNKVVYSSLDTGRCGMAHRGK